MAAFGEEMFVGRNLLMAALVRNLSGRFGEEFEWPPW